MRRTPYSPSSPPAHTPSRPQHRPKHARDPGQLPRGVSRHRTSALTPIRGRACHFYCGSSAHGQCFLQIKRDKLTLFDFWANWCAPCKKISPVYEQMSNTTPNAEFYKINVEEQPEIIEEVTIRGVRANADTLQTIC